MAFQNVVFPVPLLIHGVQRTYTHAYVQIQNGNQVRRIQKQRYGFHEWKLNEKAFNPAGLQEMLNFLADRKYGVYSFLFKDPVDQKGYVNMQLPYASGNLFSLVKPGADGTATKHPIFHIDPSAVVTKNGVAVPYTKVITNNVPYISVTGAGAGDVIRISGDYYHSVYINQASSVTTVAALDHNNNLAYALLEPLSVREVFEWA